MVLKHTITAAVLAALSRGLCAGAAWMEVRLDPAAARAYEAKAAAYKATLDKEERKVQFLRDLLKAAEERLDLRKQEIITAVGEAHTGALRRQSFGYTPPQYPSWVYSLQDELEAKNRNKETLA
jgi:hypothetical protein